MIRYSNIESGETQLPVADFARVESARLDDPKKSLAVPIGSISYKLDSHRDSRLDRAAALDQTEATRHKRSSKAAAKPGKANPIHSRATPKKASDRKSVVITFEVLGH